MTKIAQNIATLREERNMTQETLAAMLQMPLELVMDMENGRFQPNYVIIDKLKQIFGVSTEVLVNGPDYVKRLEEKKQKNRKIVSIALTSVGTLLLAVGIVIVFFDFWQRVAEMLKGVLGFLPLAAGAGFGMYVAFSKKKEKLVWRESAGVAWIVGIAATNALINSIYSVDFGFGNLLLADIVLTLPAMFIFDAIAPFTASLGMLAWYNIYGGESVLLSAIGFLLFAVPAVFVLKTHKEHTKYMQISGMLCLGAGFMGFIKELNDDYLIITAAIFAALFFIYAAADKLSYKVLSKLAFVGTVITVFLAGLDNSTLGYNYFTEMNVWEGAAFVIAFSLAAGTVTASLIINRKKLSEYATDIIMACSGILAFLMNVLNELYKASVIKGFGEVTAHTPVLMYICAIFCFIYGTAAIVKGILNSDILDLNVGIIMVFATLMVILSDVSGLGVGLTLIAMGIILLTVNSVLTRKFRQSKSENEQINAESEVKYNA